MVKTTHENMELKRQDQDSEHTQEKVAKKLVAGVEEDSECRYGFYQRFIDGAQQKLFHTFATGSSVEIEGKDHSIMIGVNYSQHIPWRL